MKTNKWHLSDREAARHCNGGNLTKYRRRQYRSKIHRTVSKFDETWCKFSLAIYHYVKLQQVTTGLYLRDSAIKSKQDGKHMAEIVFSWRVGEIKCILFIENKDNPDEIYNNYIKLSIVFHSMIICFRK